jgi:transaldolase/glucose-6-phosphate isomerase
VNPLKSLHDQGQAIWLDFLSRRFLAEGGLKKLVVEDGLTGVTSNPSIFKKALADSADYDDALKAGLRDHDYNVMGLYESVAIEDIRNAADILRPVYDAEKGRDGFVSLEVSPYLANDTKATIAEAERLWKAVARKNLMIKVPGTKAGLPAIRHLLGHGINVNITLLFARSVYADVVEAYFSGLEQFVARGGDPKGVASVASFFVSRIDSAVDKRIDAHLAKMPAGPQADMLRQLKGKIAIANAKLAYQDYKKLFFGARWKKLSDAGARVQRLLWASTSTKDPSFRDVLYVEELIGPDTVNTLPADTLAAFRDHGKLRPSLEENIAGAEKVLATLHEFGIALDDVTTKLTLDAVSLFADAFDDLLGGLARKRAAIVGPRLNGFSASLPPEIEKDVTATLEAWRTAGNMRRLWQGDASLWTSADEAKWLGWLSIVGEEQADRKRLAHLAKDASGFSHVLLLGMGGSSLGAEVFAKTFGPVPGHPELLVLDSTDPAQIKNTEHKIDLAHTLFVVSSKSGTTLEPNILKEYFFARAQSVLGAKTASHFLAVTDPESQLQALAAHEKFRAVCLGKADIGGRYSVLSDFGLVPAALMGVDTEKFLASAREMVLSAGEDVPPADNPGARLGIALGILARNGRDKLTIAASPGIADFGAWLEQLVAESTGKHGKGLIPVDGETLGAPELYGNDRIFAYIRLQSAPDAAQDAAIDALEQKGHPVLRVSVTDPDRLGQEFFRWEMATAIAGAIIGINPFDQPDVEASKVKTRELMDAYEKKGSLPPETPLLEADGIAVFADAANAKALKDAGGATTLADVLKAHFSRLGEGDYCALLAYVARNAQHQNALHAIRMAVRDKKHVATCLGFGPRFLHSTGQAYKGGPNSGVFLQITGAPTEDLPVPGHHYAFGAVIAAQARGDLAVLNERGRRALRLHLGADVEAGLATLLTAIRQALT